MRAEEAMLDPDVVFTALMGCETLDEAERKALDLEAEAEEGKA